VKLKKVEIFDYITFKKFTNLSENKIKIEYKNKTNASNQVPSIHKLNI